MNPWCTNTFQGGLLPSGLPRLVKNTINICMKSLKLLKFINKVQHTDKYVAFSVALLNTISKVGKSNNVYWYSGFEFLYFKQDSWRIVKRDILLQSWLFGFQKKQCRHSRQAWCFRVFILGYRAVKILEIIFKKIKFI